MSSETSINGRDLSNVSHDEAVEAFRNAQEPILVEVLRRVNQASEMKDTSASKVMSVSTQTEQALDNSCYACINEALPATACSDHGSYFSPSCEQCLLLLRERRCGGGRLEVIHSEEEVENEEAAEQDHAYCSCCAFNNMEYEEVTLRRESSRDKLGLTLCYSSPSTHQRTQVFVGEIDPDGIAAIDGRIREGDLIVQINDTEVESRDDAIRLFSEACTDITLVLARPRLLPAQVDDGFMEVQDPLEELEVLSECPNVDFMDYFLEEGIDEEGGTTDTGTTENSLQRHEKDSGVGRTDESTKNDESSEQEMLDDCGCQGSACKFPHSCHDNNFNHSNDSITSGDTPDNDSPCNAGMLAKECDNFKKLLESKCARQDECHVTHHRKDSHGSIEQEIAALNQEMAHIQLQCQEIINSHITVQHKLQCPTQAVRTHAYYSPRVVPKMGTRLDQAKHNLGIVHENQDPVWIKNDLSADHVVEIQHDANANPQVTTATTRCDCKHDQDDATTSAYNTATSSSVACQSPHLTLQLHSSQSEHKSKRHHSLLSLTPSTNKDSRKQPDWASHRTARGSDEHRSHKVPKSQSSSCVGHTTESVPTKDQSLQDIYSQYADVMYTNKANLAHTIMIQQKLFRQQLAQRDTAQPRDSPSKSLGQNTSLAKTDSAVSPEDGATKSGASCLSGVEMEWVVKRRADGTRYITRRPLRSKILKERARKVAEERRGASTDDDAMSELKLGRYWSKDDRRRHLEKAREHRKRKEMLIKSKTQDSDEKVKVETNKKLSIIELSHRKMMRNRDKGVFDDFTTLDEMLAHGSRDSDGKPYNPLLSVTTV